VTTGAAGALVLSITFIEKLAPNPDPRTRDLLLGAWVLLGLTLGLNFAGHFFSQKAFDRYLRNFDKAYCDGVPCDHESASSRASRWLDAFSGITFIVGIILLAAFATTNLRFNTNATVTVDPDQARETVAGTVETPASTETGSSAP
jgi:hypothetical protein